MTRPKRSSKQAQSNDHKKVKKSDRETAEQTKKTEPSVSEYKDLLDDSEKENIFLKEELEKIKAKYAEKKQIINELKQTNKEQEQKLMQMDQYIMKLKKDRKIAETVHKNNVSNLITTSAQNQALMAVLTTQQHSVHQSILPTVFPRMTLQPNPNVLPSHYSLPINFNNHNNQMSQPNQFESSLQSSFNNVNHSACYGLYPPNPFYQF